MSRIAHVNLGGSASAADGIGAVVATLAAEQERRGTTVLVLGPAWAESDAGEPPPLFRAKRELARFAPDAVHFHSVYRPAHALLALWCRAHAVPYVVSPHSGLAAAARRRQAVRKAWWIRLVDAPMLRRARAVVCLSGQERDDVLAAAPRAGTRIVANLLAGDPADVPRWTGGIGGTGDPGAAPHPSGVVAPAGDGIPAAPGTGGGPGVVPRPRVLTLARYDVHQKGLDRIAELAARLPGIDFTVHGTFDKNDPDGARRLIDAAPPNLDFAGVVTGEEKDRALAGADLYLQPSRWEGMSVAVLEAMRAGVPCAVSPEVAPTLGADGAAGVCVLPNEPDDAARTLSAALADPAAGRARARAAAAWVQRTTAPGAIVESLAAAYGIAARGKASGRRRAAGITAP
ncbi:glycosyltransferase family 4 protein [Zafaria sp. Z1313]|uniref:glycosyltransferase family 4 protein n=1 Tax=Zafaria sp. Z1313 TaxID=3423202 RepID=UPI003D3025FF